MAFYWCNSGAPTGQNAQDALGFDLEVSNVEKLASKR
jgi:hypothetical protein